MTDEKPQKRKYRRRESWGSIRRLPSGRYQASYPAPDGERYTGPGTYDTLTDARAWLYTQKRLIDAGRWRSPRAIQAERFGKYAGAYVEQGLGRGGKPFSPKTRSEYLRYIDGPLAEFRDLPLSAITAPMVRTWHARRMAKAPTAAAREASFMHAVFARAIRDEVVEKNPVDPELRRSRTGKKHRIPTLDELAAVVAWFDEHKPRLTAWVWIAAYSSPRKSEVRALRRQDLVRVKPSGDESLAFYEVHVRRQAYRVGKDWHTGAPKSEAGNRVAALPPALTSIIDGHLSEHVGPFPHSLLFPPDGPSDFIDDTAFDRPWRRAREHAGLVGDDVSVRLHDLRGLALTLYGLSGATQREIQARGGHSTIAAAARYQHVTGRDAQLAAQLPLPPAAPPRPASLDEKRRAKDTG